MSGVELDHEGASGNKLNYWHRSLELLEHHQHGPSLVSQHLRDLNREELHSILNKIHIKLALQLLIVLNSGMCWRRSGTSDKHFRAACDGISPERAAFSLRCCPRLLHYSLKLTAEASVPAFDLTSDPSVRKKRGAKREREKE